VSTRRFSMPAGHPVFAGHFPGHPVVPGAWLLDRVLEAAREEGLGGPWRLHSAKFLSPAGPDEILELSLSGSGDKLGFQLHSGERLVASGSIGRLEPAS